MLMHNLLQVEIAEHDELDFIYSTSPPPKEVSYKKVYTDSFESSDHYSPKYDSFQCKLMMHNLLQASGDSGT